MTPGDIKSIDDLKSYLHRAMQLEHATIPPYLTALYSIHPGTNRAAVGVLRTVVVEEMLHLTIAANLLNAVGGEPDMTAKGFVPPYPTYLPDGENRFQVHIQAFSEAALDTFLLIEQPNMARPHEPRITRQDATYVSVLATSPLNPDMCYISIGEFYEEIRRGIVYLTEQNGNIFSNSRPGRQVTSEYYYSGGGRLFPVTGIESAQEAIRLIVEQGEGEGGGIYDHKRELAHYFRFQELKKGRYYQPGDAKDDPTGPALEVDWDAAYPIKQDARVSDFRDPELREAAVAFNNFYGQYLQMLNRAYNGEPAVLLEAVPKMFEIRNRMQQLMCNPIGDGSGSNASPTFEINATEAPS